MRLFSRKEAYPGVQPAIGTRQDTADFAPPTGIVGTLRAMFRGRVYEMPAEDAQRLRPTFVRSERAIAREKALAARRDRLRRSGAPIFVDDDGEVWSEPPRAEILRAAPRPAADLGDWNSIIMPGGAGNGTAAGR